MFKRQKSKILVFLLLLGLLYGCKRQILDPLNPQTNLPQKAQFDKVKCFYEKGRYKNQPKRSSNGNERMTAADSARFKDFEPEWDKTEVELLPNNEKMLIVPVVRFLQVEYSQEISFIRRLCIRVDENDDFLEANIVELVGNLTFVKSNYNSIFKNYKENNISGFSGVIAVSSLDYTSQVMKGYKNGLFVGITQMPTQEIDPATGKVSTCVAFSTVWISTHYCHNAGLPDHGTATNCNPNSGYWESSYSFFTCDSGDSSGGTGSGGSNTNTGTNNSPTGQPQGTGTSGSPTGGTSTTIDTGCSFCELDENATPPSVTGDIYTNAKANIDDRITNLMFDVFKQDTTTQDIKVKLRMLNGLKQMRAIMTKIEENTKGVDLNVIANATDTTGGTKYDVANKRLQVTMPTAPVLPATPTPDQEDEYVRKMTKHLALLAHELKHVEQYLDGKVSFNKLTGGQGVLVDASDEVECYTLYFLIRGQINLDCSTTIQIQAMPIYANLPSGPLGRNNPPAAGLATDFYIP